jgi:hypothetical protein
MAKYSLDEQAWGTAVWLVLKEPSEEKLSYAIQAFRGVALHGHPAVKVMEQMRGLLRQDLDQVDPRALQELERHGRRLGLLPPAGQLQDSLLSSK